MFTTPSIPAGLSHLKHHETQSMDSSGVALPEELFTCEKILDENHSSCIIVIFATALLRLLVRNNNGARLQGGHNGIRLPLLFPGR